MSKLQDSNGLRGYCSEIPPPAVRPQSWSSFVCFGDSHASRLRGPAVEVIALVVCLTSNKITRPSSLIRRRIDSILWRGTPSLDPNIGPRAAVEVIHVIATSFGLGSESHAVLIPCMPMLQPIRSRFIRSVCAPFLRREQITGLTVDLYSISHII
jgi:hypothetical protein